MLSDQTSRSAPNVPQHDPSETNKLMQVAPAEQSEDGLESPGPATPGPDNSTNKENMNKSAGAGETPMSAKLPKSARKAVATPVPDTPPLSASMQPAIIDTPKGSDASHREMQDVISDLKFDFTQTSQVLRKLDSFGENDSPLPPMDSGPVPPELVMRLREELRAARAAVRVLKLDKDKTHHKLERLDQLLLKERSSLRDVLNAARKAFADLKSEKEQMRKRLYKERAKYSDGIAAERAQRRKLEEQLTELQLQLRAKDGQAADSELKQMDCDARSAIEHERANLQSGLDKAESTLADVYAEVAEIDDSTHQAVASLFAAMEQLEKDMIEAQRGQREAEIKVETSRQRVTKLTSDANLDRAALQQKLVESLDLNRHFKAELDQLKRSVAHAGPAGSLSAAILQAELQ